MMHTLRHVPAVILFTAIAGCHEGILTSESAGPEGTYADYAASSGSSATAGGSGGQSEPGVITAGEWNDLQEWDYWNALMQEKVYSDYLDKWGLRPGSRYTVILTGTGESPVMNAPVTLKDGGGKTLWASLTDNSGRAELWGPVSGQLISAEYIEVSVGGQIVRHLNPLTSAEGENIITGGNFMHTESKVDIAFVIDATGSMSDELEYIKVELEDVLSRAVQLNEIVPRAGVVVYRDEGDEYVTRSSPLSEDPLSAIRFVQKQAAGGGGDYPEAVHSALQVAIGQFQWNPNASARLLFLVLDAPPHDSKQIIRDMGDLIKSAAAAGIRIIPVTASGIEKETEFLMRAMGILTNATYVFITDHSGIGNDHLAPTVGEYEVEYLNDLLVRLITECSR